MGPMINQSSLCSEIPVKAVGPEGEWASRLAELAECVVGRARCPRSTGTAHKAIHLGPSSSRPIRVCISLWLVLIYRESCEENRSGVPGPSVVSDSLWPHGL